MTSTGEDRSLTRQPAVPWETLTDQQHGAANIRHEYANRVPFGDCLACGKPVRWSTAYNEPHWVHVTTADILACPTYTSAR